jgi:hypothetical protein
MKTARFAAVVAAAGKPDIHLLLVSPEKDKTLQAAIRSHRVMTVHQEVAGNRKDHGIVGFHPGPARQFLIFPRSISKFEGSRIVAVKYDLLGDDKERVKPPKTRQNVASKRKVVKAKKPAHPKIVHFPEPNFRKARDEGSEAIQEIKNQVRQAMAVLEQGKQVAAFNILKQIVDR